MTTVEAAEAVGVSWPVGVRWFRHAGGMPPISLAEPTGRYLSFEEREEIAVLRALENGVREIARGSGVTRDDLSRTAPQRRDARRQAGVPRIGRAVESQQAAKRPKTAKLAGNDSCVSTCRTGSPAWSAPRRHDLPGPDARGKG